MKTNLFLALTCFCCSPCRVISIHLFQPNLRKAAAITLNAPMFGSCDRPPLLNNRPEICILSSDLYKRMGTFPLGGWRIFALKSIMSSIEVKGLKMSASNVFPNISTPNVSNKRVPKIYVSVGFTFCFICKA